MSEFLTVRLNSQPDSQIHWAVWSTSQQEVIASGELNNLDQLADIKEYAQQRVTLLMLSGQDVHFADVEILRVAHVSLSRCCRLLSKMTLHKMSMNCILPFSVNKVAALLSLRWIANT